MRQLVLCGILFCCVLACNKKDSDPILGNIELVLTVQHHNEIVAFSTVHLDFDPSVNPGTDPSNYDQQHQTNASGVVTITNLFAGNYALLGTGHDGIDTVTGTAYITLQKPLNGDSVFYTLQVSE